jgi:predicted ATPase/class 3 adenylate cyclase
LTEQAGTDQRAASTPASSSLLTFLIADVRGYTRFTVEQGDEAAARLADRFAELCEKTVEQREGKVIELRGDEALCVFSSARNALRAAVALQAAYKEAMVADPSLPLTVGMGLDAGEPIPVRGGYRGGALNLAARLCSIAGAGEILASEGVIHLARKTEGLSFVDRGQVTLKGLSSPVRVLQIARDGELPSELPPLQPILVTHPTNLPDDPTPFIGREREIDQITGLLREPHIRLVTLTGPGGTGKTRLALQVGNTLLYSFPDGVFFCDLAPLADPTLVLASVASMLGVQEEAGKGIEEAVIAHVGTKQLLLVLDNFEQVIDAAPVVARLLDACRELRILVTSRTPLHVTRENEYAVSPLAVPDPTSLPDLETLSQYESVALFIQRARAAKHGFAITNENAPAVAEICYRLDGLPLAIELAAARLKLFSPQALLQRLDSRLKLLTGGARDRPSRQQTLRGTIDWSYSLLSEEEQALFAWLSVFAGGWTFEAAEAVCNPHGELDVLDGMASLVAKSLVRSEGEEELRFSMLETIREYASERLAERGEAAEVKRLHAEYFLALARTANLTIEDEGEMRHDIVIRDWNNVRTALEWAFESGDMELGGQLVAALENYWVATRPHEGQHWHEAIRERLEELPASLRAHVLRSCGNLGSILGDADEGTWFWERSLAEYRGLGDERGIGIVLQRLANQDALQIADPQQARKLVEESLALHRKIGFTKGEAVSLGVLADLAQQAGDPNEVLPLLERSAALAEESGFVWWLAATRLRIAELQVQLGHVPSAEARIRQALPLITRMGNRQWTVYAFALLARSAAQTGRSERAGRLWGAIEAEETRAPIGGWEAERDKYAAPVLAYGGTEFERGRHEGRNLSLSEAVEYASQLDGDS